MHRYLPIQESSPPSRPPSAPQAEEGPVVITAIHRSAIPTYHPHAPLTPLVCDPREITRLLDSLLGASGLTQKEVAEKLRISPASLNQYFTGRRTRVGLYSFIKLVAALGGHVHVEFPAK